MTATGHERDALDGTGITSGGQHSRPLVSFVIPGLTTGGAEQVTVDIVNGLVGRGYDVELLLSRTEGELRSGLADEVDVVCLWPDRNRVFGVATHLPALVEYLQNRNPAVLFSHLAPMSVTCLVAARFVDTDTVFVPTEHLPLHVPRNSTLKSRIVCRLIPHLYPSADHVVAVSEGVADSIAEQTAVQREKISVLYNPVDVETVREQARDPVDHEWIGNDEMDTVLSVGRIEPQKDLETWLRAFRRVHDRNPDARAVLAGTGSQESDLRSLAARLGIADAVSMPGYVENPFGYMSGASLFLLSSRYEGLPTVLIEALACGCQVVATDCPSGPREILASGKFGRLAPVGDPAGLADAVVETLREPNRADELVRRAEAFAPGPILDEYERFLHEFVLD